VAHQHIFGRNGAVGLELETPVAVAVAERQKRMPRAVDAVIERIKAGVANCSARAVTVML